MSWTTLSVGDLSTLGADELCPRGAFSPLTEKGQCALSVTELWFNKKWEG